MTKDDWINLGKDSIKNWHKILLWILIALISYYGWYKSLFFIPHDWKVTDEEGEFISRARSYFALLLSIGTPSLLFWIYNKKQKIIKNLEQKFYKSLYRSRLERRILEQYSGLKEKITEVEKRLEGARDTPFGYDVVLSVLRAQGQPLGVNFQDEIKDIQTNIDVYIDLAYEVKGVFYKSLSKDLINSYPEAINDIAYNLLDKFLISYKKQEYLAIDIVFNLLNQDCKPVADLCKRVLNIIYRKENLEEWFGKYTFQQNDFDLEVLNQFMSKEENRELLKSNFAQIYYRMVL
jgi:hypothetical protein